jgi:hypothetical protein
VSEELKTDSQNEIKKKKKTLIKMVAVKHCYESWMELQEARAIYGNREFRYKGTGP